MFLQYSPKIMHAQEVTQEVLAPQEVKMPCFCGLPARTFRAQEVESLTVRTYESYRKLQEEQEVAEGQTVCSFISQLPSW